MPRSLKLRESYKTGNVYFALRGKFPKNVTALRFQKRHHMILH